jgi:hypothetical protein
MEQFEIRDTRIALPNIDDAELDDVGTLTTRLGALTGFRLTAAKMRSLELTGRRLASGRVTRLNVGSARLEDLRMDSVDFVSLQTT